MAKSVSLKSSSVVSATGTGYIADKLQFYVDPTGDLTVEQVMAFKEGLFTRGSNEILNFGFSQQVVWIRWQPNEWLSSIDALLQNSPLWVIEFPTINLLEWFTVKDGKATLLYRTGTEMPFNTRPIHQVDFAFPLLSEGVLPDEIYLRVRATNALVLPIKIDSEMDFNVMKATVNMGWGAIYGLIALVALINIFLVVLLKKSYHLYYAGYAISCGMTGASLSGHAFQFIWPNHPEINGFSISLFTSLMIFFGMRFSMSFLDAKRNMPEAYPFASGLASVALLVAASSLFLQLDLSFIAAVMVSLFGPLAAYMGMLGVRRKVVGARISTSAWLVYLIGASTYGLVVLGVIQPTLTRIHLKEVGVSLEIILLSIGIAIQIRASLKAQENLRRIAADELSENLKKYEILYQQSHDALFQIHNKDRTIIFNQSFKKLFDIKNISTRNGAPLSQLNKRTLAFIYDIENMLHKKNGRISGEEYSISDLTEGKQRWVNISASYVKDNHEDYDIIDVSMMDITDSKLRTEAEKSNAAKSKFLAAASHDLRQPLHSIALFASALGAQLGQSPQLKLVEKIQYSVSMLTELFDETMDISKLDAGIIIPIFSSFYLKEIFAALQNDFKTVAENKGLKFRICSCNKIIVRADKILLERILRNFATNAIRYTPKGKILIGCRRENSSIRVEVHDTGIGISEWDLEKIFNEYTQLNINSLEAPEGIGLGLSIASRLAKIMDFPIEVKSSVRKGSVFTISVPVSIIEKHSQNTEISATLQKTLLTDLSILAIEDDDTVREALTTLLSTWGCDITAVASIEEAEMHAKNFKMIDLLIVDYQLQGKETGLDAITIIKNATPDVFHILIITGSTLIERSQLLKNTEYHILHKPIIPAQLRAYLNAISREKKKK